MKADKVPMNNNYISEYSLAELKKLVSKYFVIEKIIGLKRDRIFFNSDPKGTNTIVICKKGGNDVA